MRSSAGARRAWAVGLLAAAFAPGCSILIHPDDSRLNPPGADGAAPDVVVTDASAPDAVGDAGGDTNRADVPVPNDVPHGDDVVVTGDVPTVDAPIDDVPVADAPPQCPASCDDGVACTTDACDASTGTCTHTPNDALCGPPTPICHPTMGCVQRPCSTNQDCSDGNACNGTEICQNNGRCAPGTPLVCDDGQFCNGTETCSPTLGCQAGTPPVCADANPCTTDACNTAGGGACVHTPVDADGDGAPAASVSGTACAGGTDCNDMNNAIGPASPERCNNGIDDNCNGQTDEGCNGGPPANDTCANATPISLVGGAGTVTGTTLNAANGPQSSCGGSGGDVWYSVTYPGTQTLRVEIIPDPSDPNVDPVVELRSSCTSQDIVCNDDYSSSSTGSRAWIRPDPANTGMRTVYIIADTYQAGSEGAFTLNVAAFDDLEQDVCGSPSIFDMSEGGTVVDYRVPSIGHERGSCGSDGPEDVYRYDGPSGQVRMVAFTNATRFLSLYARSGGCLPSTYNELGCQGGNPANLNVNAPSAGMNVFVDGLSTVTSYYLRVQTP